MYQRFLAFFTLKKRYFYTILVKIREVCQIMLANKHCKAINLWYYGNVPKKLGSYNSRSSSGWCFRTMVMFPRGWKVENRFEGQDP